VDSPLTATAPVFVNRKDVKVETVTEDIGFGTETVEDPNLSFGVKAVRQQGTPGKKAVTYQVNTQTGARTPFNEFVIQAPIPQIVARGSYINIPNDKQSVMAAAGINRSDCMLISLSATSRAGTLQRLILAVVAAWVRLARPQNWLPHVQPGSAIQYASCDGSAATPAVTVAGAGPITPGKARAGGRFKRKM
jgi:hypothetical protein